MIYDQFENADILVKMKVGVRLKCFVSELSITYAEDMQEAIDEALVYSESARTVSRRMNKPGQQGSAVHVHEFITNEVKTGNWHEKWMKSQGLMGRIAILVDGSTGK